MNLRAHKKQQQEKMLDVDYVSLCLYVFSFKVDTNNLLKMDRQ